LETRVQDDAEILPAGPIYALILNALRNAVDAIDTADRQAGRSRNPVDPHRITLCAEIHSQELHLRITDTGCGLEPSLVDAQGQFRYGRTTKSGGHGLGLTISRDIATQLGGQLRLTNREAGGAVLSVRYPVSAVLGDA
jgi:C4-dicarboxylate-specific signal transduction histidine kinase